MFRFFRLLAGAAPLCVLAPQARAENELRPVDRASLLAMAVRAHPAVRASEQRAAARALEAKSEGSLPAPEAMMQIWQVPIARPQAINEAQMVMFGVGQSFPAIGARAALERAGELEAAAERAMTADRARQIRREVDHAYADYVEATARHRIHLEHRLVATRTFDLARARHGVGGSLGDAAQAEVERARVESDVVTDATRIEAARRRINALLGRDALAPLGPPVDAEPETSAWDLRTAVDAAHASRPELRAAEAQRGARAEEARAAAKEAAIPSFSVAALYFAPTTPMPQHGYGVNASVTLPWLWGEAAGKRDARRQAAAAAGREAIAARIPIHAEVVNQEATVRAAGLRLLTLRDRALPASRRSFEVAWAGYEAGRTDVLTLLSTRRAVVDVETESIVARASLDHALADLEAAIGTELPRRKLTAEGSIDGH